jgi:hypothetical protein
VGREAAEILARKIIESLPDQFKTTIMEWRFIEERITQILMENPALIIGSINEENWLDYNRVT